MAIKIVEERTCDWCGGDDPDGLHTHRLVFDRRAVEVELHNLCQEDATLLWLLEHGRRPTAAQIEAAAAKEQRIPCPFCGKPCVSYMGVTQHITRSHADLDPDERRRALFKIKEGLK
jgi:hypothetical protein